MLKPPSPKPNTPHLSVFSPNAGKYGSEKLRIRIPSRSEWY